MNVLPISVVALATFPMVAQEQQPSPPPLSEAKFGELLALLTPTENAMWRQIPWRIELLEAQREAAEHNKPLFIWAMDGHPLGCT